MKIGYWICVILTRMISRVFFGCRIYGAEQVPQQGRLILAANHQSYFDPPLVGSCLRREIFYLAKAELFRNPAFGALLRYWNSIPVRRGGQDVQSLKQALAVLEQGEALLIFPEGTRSRTGELRRGTSGLGLLAKQSGAPVIPVFVQGTFRWRHSFLRRGGIKVFFGKPLQYSVANVEHSSGSKAYAAFVERVMGCIAALGKNASAH